VSTAELTQHWEREFLLDLERLNVTPPASSDEGLLQFSLPHSV
jgi:hypothetical protein